MPRGAADSAAGARTLAVALSPRDLPPVVRSALSVRRKEREDNAHGGGGVTTDPSPARALVRQLPWPTPCPVVAPFVAVPADAPVLSCFVEPPPSILRSYGCFSSSPLLTRVGEATLLGFHWKAAESAASACDVFASCPATWIGRLPSRQPHGSAPID